MSDKFISPLYYCDLFTKKNVGTKKQRKDLLDKIKKTKSINIHKGETTTGGGKSEGDGGNAFAAKTNTYSGGKTIDSPSTPGGKYGSPK